MTENKTDEQRISPVDTNPKDFLLTQFVSTSNSTSLELGLTLNIGGTLITGTLVSGETYCEGVAQSFSNTGGKVGEGLADAIRLFGKKVFGSESEDEDNDNDTGPDMIHLKNATVHQGQNKYHTQWWRGKLRSVDGFSFGTFSE